MILVYVTATTVILVLNYEGIPGAIGLVFQSAFTGTAAAGGFLGAGVAQAIHFGVARGIFSNESGLGSAGIAAAAAQTREPVRQALVSMTQTFIDTLMVCSFTGLAIITTGAWQSGLNGPGLTQRAFAMGLPGQWGGIVVAVSLALFAFSTILGWSYYGEKSLEYLLGTGAVLPYRIAFVMAAFLGSLGTIEVVWLLSDVLNGLMAIPNLIGLLLLSGLIVRETRAYFLMKDGAVLEETKIPLAANGQEARYIEEMFTFTGAAVSDFVGSVRGTVPAVGEGMFTGVAVEIDEGNRILTTLPVVPVQERMDRE